MFLRVVILQQKVMMVYTFMLAFSTTTAATTRTAAMITTSSCCVDNHQHRRLFAKNTHIFMTPPPILLLGATPPPPTGTLHTSSTTSSALFSYDMMTKLPVLSSSLDQGISNWLLASSSSSSSSSPSSAGIVAGIGATSGSSTSQQESPIDSSWLRTSLRSTSMFVSASTGAPVVTPPSSADIELLQQAFSEFSKCSSSNTATTSTTTITTTLDDWMKTIDLFTQVLSKWDNQPPDEIAGLYRVRADCYMQIGFSKQAIDDYSAAIQYLLSISPTGSSDPSELPLTLLGKARALKASSSSSGTTRINIDIAKQSAKEYEKGLILLSSQSDYLDSDIERIEDGTIRNPYAAWEYGTVLHWIGNDPKAAQFHTLASYAFNAIGDRSRSAISLIDAGIDLACLAAADSSNNNDEKKNNYYKDAIATLKEAIMKTRTNIEGRDILLLQRVIAKEGEGRLALAALLWTNQDNSNTSNNDRAEAENILGEACIRFEQLQVDASSRNSNLKYSKSSSSSLQTASSSPSPQRLLYSIDDEEQRIPSIDRSCSKFKNEYYVKDQLGWSSNLQRKVNQLMTLK